MNDDEARYEAVRARDARFDGVFFTCVTSTGIYCRPSCPATTPKRANVRFHRSAAAAQADGFRACRRCRPDAVPGSAEWNARADSVGRAMLMIADGVVDREGVPGLAARLGYSERQLRRQLIGEVGAGPVALARAQRAHAARTLLQTTGIDIAAVAFAAGFSSIRQFNETVRQVYDRTPGQLRAAGPGPAPGAGDGGIALRLAHRGTLDTDQVFGFLARRAVPGIEEVVGEPGSRAYRRTLRLPHGHGVAEVGEAGGAGWLPARLALSDPRDLTAAVQRVRRLFDLDADPYAVSERLAGDPALGAAAAARPGVRSPGTTDPDELAVRAVLGQQVTVTAARKLAADLVADRGEPLPAPDGGLTRLFPRAADLADAPLRELRMPESRRAALRALTAALADGGLVLDPGADREEAEHRLLALRGIGPWTAGYVRMRALGDPDVMLTGDTGVRQGVRLLGCAQDDAVRWRPWRSYALHHLWLAAAGASSSPAPPPRARRPRPRTLPRPAARPATGPPSPDRTGSPVIAKP
ncbi:AlkA N-terminal domain-containing protein [Streptomyces lonarensis]|uniref:DNA-3-methyladenine glycosylase II n=1 Tax=Streptomyces lonarensis TaxID=700599 RepID=A0A7X6D2Z9_9ACTN|nr:AlkA N-terminal domain-containing protein [Streptomyces lonarensis]NJQ07182.1 DNA-3-methyladenine glycosylase 2 family protein [Streptomyces lonarensis]